jgi:UDP-N-acetylmuramyl pentapeptide phosphotransferase/UDP-N-acetylglucosamine-1-phosphate transferase
VSAGPAPLLALSWAVAATTTLLLLLALERWASRLGLVDRPNARSSHRQPRPRGGGAAIVVGLLAGWATAAARGLELSPAAWIVLAAAVGIGLLGLWDDLAPRRAAVRVAVQCGVALALVAALGGFDRVPLPPPADLPLPAAAGAALAVLWLVAVTNFFNFMDGIDGLAAGQALVTILALAAVGAPQGIFLLLLLVAPLGVFLAFNWAPARLFLGDVGSAFLGFLLAASPWLAAEPARTADVVLLALVLSLFLLDPLWTLARRWRRGARLTESHREHLYQRLTADGRGHARVAIALVAAAALLAGLGVWSYGDAARIWTSFGCALLLFLLELRLARS